MVIAAAFMTLCTKSSFLYPMNDWSDIHCFQTMGRGLLQGKVLYRDLYEQKGPLLYFIYALLAGATPGSFMSVYLMEIACFSAFLYYSGKCIRLYVKSKWAPLWMLPLLSVAVATASAFSHGGSVEEMCLFMVVCSMYLVLRAVRERQPLPGRDAFAIGVFASAAFWIKYTLCGFYAGLALFVALYYLIGLRRGKELLQTIGLFLGGLTPITLGVLTYFIATGALRDLFQAYFYNNIFLYSATENGNVGTMVYNVLWYTYVILWHNPFYMGLMILGLLWFLWNIRTGFWELLAVALGVGFMAVFIFAGGAYYGYYGLYYSSFSVFGLIAVGRLWQWFAEKRSVTVPRIVGVSLCAAVFVGLLVCSYRISPNTYLMKYDKKDMPQYKFAAIINREEGASLLNYGFLDSGFYFASGVDPEVKYFCKLNIPLPEMLVEQNRYVRQQQADYVVVRSKRLRDQMDALPQYHLEAEAEMFFEGDVRTYYLYAKN